MTEPPLGPVNIDLHPGEIALLAGPSGSGKTRLMRLLADLDHPAEGRVELHGRPVESFPAPEYRRTVGYLPATPALGPGTLRGLMAQVRAFGERPPGADPEQALAALGLGGDVLDRPAASLSTGETLRAALALLLSGSPRVLLLDEPTGALDPGATALVEEAIRARAEAGTAVLWAIHDPAQAARMGHALYHLEGDSLRGPERDPGHFWAIMHRFETRAYTQGESHDR